MIFEIQQHDAYTMTVTLSDQTGTAISLTGATAFVTEINNF